jgi:carboxyl-terminal processing protease
MKRASIVILFVLSVAAVVGFWMGHEYQKGVLASKIPYKELEKFSKVLQFVESNYVEDTKAPQLLDGAIRGMLNSLDPHSSYLSQDVYREMKEETQGKFGGLGIEVTVKDGLITVLSPIEDSPAFRAGIKAGDQIIRIGDVYTKNLQIADAITLMRGKPGSTIKITLFRRDTGKSEDMTLKRESVRLQSVKSTRIEGDIGYFRITSFIERSGEDLAKHFDRMNKEKPLVGMILDLRGNPGGLLDQAVRVTNLFIDEGPVVYTIGRDHSKKEVENARKGRKMTDLPLVTLVDGSSASASEIVAGALQDYGRSIIAGQQTFGKGSVQQVIPLGDESGLKLTVSRYYTPSGRSIQVKGITPDVTLDNLDPKVIAEAKASASRRIREADLEGHFDNEDEAPAIAKREATATPLSPANTEVLPLVDRLKTDYMVVQSQGILRTYSVLKKGLQKPEFKIDVDARMAKAPKAEPINSEPKAEDSKE